MTSRLIEGNSGFHKCIFSVLIIIIVAHLCMHGSENLQERSSENYEFQCIVEVLLCVSTKQLPQNYIFTYIVSQV